MIFDFATISAIVLSLVILVFLIVNVRATERRIDARIRHVAHQSALIGSNDLARDLCKVVREHYPRACPCLDFTIEEDERGVHISAWYLPGPQPTERRRDIEGTEA
jgi:hypothetical protein